MAVYLDPKAQGQYPDGLIWKETTVYAWDKLRSQWGDALDFRSVEVYLFRHGETEYNRRGLVSGTSDVCLTPQGRAAAARMGETLAANFSASFCSGLSRSCESLQLALQAARLTGVPQWIDVRLRERSLGELEGRTAVHVPQFATGDLEFTPAGGESYRALAQRCLSFLLDLQRATATSHWEKVLISTHMGPMRVLDALFHGEEHPEAMMARTYPNARLVRIKPAIVHWPRYL